ncbi:hypothetical protein PSACC_03217 [Paramicrosporidium saccamoebae]|uniref:Uncharacterized protein n=1 Tax=Paramicrosporidium saccamoebae TaxID=1246581 RepID=A0A2H9TH77_9FUNG|nr:hypothetical protein PSACC_03217 [Paramicrosporidium saccamoebae]
MGTKWLDEPGMCLPFAVAQLRKRELPDELLVPCVVQLCKSGCYDLAQRLVNSRIGKFPASLVLFVEIYAKRWP